MTDPVARPPHDPPYGTPPPPADALAEPGLPPTRPFGAYQPPVYGAPAEPGPASAPPVSGQPSVYGSPAPPAPAYGSAAPQSPVYGAAVPQQSPGYGSPAPQSPVYGSPAPQQSPVYGSPAGQPAAFGAETVGKSAYGTPDTYGTPQAYGAPAPGYGQIQPYDGGGAVHPYAVPAVAPYGAPAPMHRLVSPGGRLGAVLLDSLLAVVTLFIGWFVWALIVWARGQTPGKQLLGHVVADANTGVPFTWGQMFLREFVIRGLLCGLINTVTFNIFFIVDSCTVWSENNRTLHDRMAGSIVRHVDQ